MELSTTSRNEDETSNCNKISQCQAQLRDLAVIGVEYIIEVQISENVNSIIHCVLCEEKFELTDVINHLTAYTHRYSYLEKHFSTAFKKISKSKDQEQRDHFAEQICKSIVAKYGILSILVVENNEFSKNRMKYFEEVLNSKHLDENMGSSFIESFTETETKDHSLSSISDEEILSLKSTKSKDLSSISDDDNINCTGGATKDDSISSLSDHENLCTSLDCGSTSNRTSTLIKSSDIHTISSSFYSYSSAIYKSKLSSSSVWPANANRIRDLRDVINAKCNMYCYQHNTYCYQHNTYYYRYEKNVNSVDEGISIENSMKHPSDDIANVTDTRRLSNDSTSRRSQNKKRSKHISTTHKSPIPRRSTTLSIKKKKKRRRKSVSPRKSRSPLRSEISYRSSRSPYRLSQKPHQSRQSPYKPSRKANQSGRPYQSSRSSSRESRSAYLTSRSAYRSSRSTYRKSRSPCRTFRSRSRSRRKYRLRKKSSQRNFPSSKKDRSPVNYCPEKVSHSPRTSQSHRKSALKMLSSNSPNDSRKRRHKRQRSKRLSRCRSSTSHFSSRRKGPKRIQSSPTTLSWMDQETDCLPSISGTANSISCSDTKTSTSGVQSIEMTNHVANLEVHTMNAQVSPLSEYRNTVAAHFVKFLTEEGRTDITPMLIEKYTNKYLDIVNGIQNDITAEQDDSTCTPVPTLNEESIDSISTPSSDLEVDKGKATKHITKDINTVSDNLTLSESICQPIQDDYTDYSSSCNLNDFELNILLKNFTHLSDVEKQKVIERLKILERDEPHRFNRLKNNHSHLSVLLKN